MYVLLENKSEIGFLKLAICLLRVCSTFGVRREYYTNGYLNGFGRISTERCGTFLMSF